MAARKSAAATPRARSGRRSAKASIEKWAGRPLAAQRHLASSLIASLAHDFETHGAATIAALRKDNPANYLRLVAALMPKDLNDENLLDRVSDEELFDAIVQLRALVAHPDRAGEQVERPEQGEPAASLPALS